MRKALVEAIGGFCADYEPMFFEDTDFSKRAVRAGYAIGMARGAYVWHKEHGSFQDKSRNAEALFRRNKKIFETKWGAILRIAWITGSPSEAADSLPHAAALARDGNFVTVYERNTPGGRRDRVQKKRMDGHSGVRCAGFTNPLLLCIHLMCKKKKFDVVVVKKNAAGFLLQIFLPCVFIEGVDSGLGPQIQRRIQKLKFPA